MITEIKNVLIERLEKNVGEHSDCKLSKSFKADIQNAIDTLETSVDTEEELAFLTLLELHTYKDTIGGLYDWLKSL